jgi:two-component system, chemotaxis family, chemotaxis protein CheY
MSSHILIVDDDPSIRAILTEILADEGYRVQTATNGAEGLEAVIQSPPDVVLLDMRMPVLDGWGFAKALRERGIRVSVVVMTAAQEAGLWAKEIGTGLVLAKPFDIDALLEVVERALQTISPD